MALYLQCFDEWERIDAVQELVLTEWSEEAKSQSHLSVSQV